MPLEIRNSTGSITSGEGKEGGVWGAAIQISTAREYYEVEDVVSLAGFCQHTVKSTIQNTSKQSHYYGL
jgi:hypothetical protein